MSSGSAKNLNVTVVGAGMALAGVVGAAGQIGLFLDWQCVDNGAKPQRRPFLPASVAAIPCHL